MQDSQELRVHKRLREEDVLEQLLKHHTDSIAWKSAGSAASDFRSRFHMNIKTTIRAQLNSNHRRCCYDPITSDASGHREYHFTG